MALTKFNTSVTAHQSLSDTPAITTSELKIAWDKPAVDSKNFVNNTLTVELDTALTIASQAEAEAGVDNVKKMTALRTNQAIVKNARNSITKSGSTNTASTILSFVKIPEINEIIHVSKTGKIKITAGIMLQQTSDGNHDAQLKVQTDGSGSDDIIYVNVSGWHFLCGSIEKTISIGSHIYTLGFGTSNPAYATNTRVYNKCFFTIEDI
jgi:hypothetical protein